MKIEVFRLNLLSPLYYVSEKAADPFGYKEGDGEKLFCFELDKTQTGEFEPDTARFLETLVFCGRASDGADGQPHTELPQGNYLFAQKREIASRKDIMEMAVEIQQEGLWQRLLCGKKLYLRYLFEDGRPVTQLFRPCTET